MTTVPAIKGQMGNIEYFQCTMNAEELVNRTKPAYEYFKENWDELSEQEKMQREVSKRYITEITPYLLRDKNRFFNSIVVRLDPGQCEFKSLEEYTLTVNNQLVSISKAIPFDARDYMKNMGLLSIKDAGNSMYILDGQHRMSAVRCAIKPSDNEAIQLKKALEKRNELDILNYKHEVEKDTLSVLFVSMKNREQERQLFSDINTYAKKISAKEAIGLSTKNGYFIIVQRVIDDKDVFNHKLWIVQSGSSLPDASLKFTTKVHLYNMVNIYCNAIGYTKWKPDVKPNEDEIKDAHQRFESFYKNFLKKIDAYNKVLDKGDPTSNDLPKLREKSNKNALLYKPLPQVALFDAVTKLAEVSDIDLDVVYKTINKIDWSFDAGSQFEDILITRAGTITTGTKVQNLLRDIIIYWVLGTEKSKEYFQQKGFDELQKSWSELTRKSGPIPKAKTK